MGRRGAALVDGLGARRIALAALPERDRVGRAVTLRPMREQDTEMVFGWQHEPGMRRYFRDPEPPDPTGHRRWCAARLADPFGLCEIVLADGKPAGLVRLDGAGASEADDEVSLLVVGAEQGKGIGTAALRALRRLSRETAMWAHIHPENRASQGSFRRAGFTLASSDRAVAAALATDQG
jgi:RimJ/RimL family protein N-acetyltransferase